MLSHGQLGHPNADTVVIAARSLNNLLCARDNLSVFSALQPFVFQRLAVLMACSAPCLEDVVWPEDNAECLSRVSGAAAASVLELQSPLLTCAKPSCGGSVLRCALCFGRTADMASAPSARGTSSPSTPPTVAGPSPTSTRDVDGAGDGDVGGGGGGGGGGCGAAAGATPPSPAAPRASAGTAPPTTPMASARRLPATDHLTRPHLLKAFADHPSDDTVLLRDAVLPAVSTLCANVTVQAKMASQPHLVLRLVRTVNTLRGRADSPHLALSALHHLAASPACLPYFTAAVRSALLDAAAANSRQAARLMTLYQQAHAYAHARAQQPAPQGTH